MHLNSLCSSPHHQASEAADPNATPPVHETRQVMSFTTSPAALTNQQVKFVVSMLGNWKKNGWYYLCTSAICVYLPIARHRNNQAPQLLGIILWTHPHDLWVVLLNHRRVHWGVSKIPRHTIHQIVQDNQTKVMLQSLKKIIFRYKVIIFSIVCGLMADSTDTQHQDDDGVTDDNLSIGDIPGIELGDLTGIDVSPAMVVLICDIDVIYIAAKKLKYQTWLALILHFQHQIVTEALVHCVDSSTPPKSGSTGANKDSAAKSSSTSHQKRKQHPWAVLSNTEFATNFQSVLEDYWDAGTDSESK